MLWQGCVPVAVPVAVPVPASVPVLVPYLDASAPVPGSSSKSQWPGSSVPGSERLHLLPLPSLRCLPAVCFLSLSSFLHRRQRMSAHRYLFILRRYDLCLVFC